MKIRGISGWAAGLSAALAAGCGGQDPSVDEAIGPADVASVTDHVVFVDHARGEARLLDVSQSSAPGSVAVVPLVANPTTHQQRNGHPDELLVLSAGQPDDGVAAPEQPGVTVVDAQGKNRTIRYESAYDALSQSEDGTRAFLYFTKNAGGAGTVLFNPNEVAIVDLDGKSDPLVLTPRPLGGTIQSVTFSPPEFSIEGVKRNLAVVLFQTYLNILDLDHPDRPEFSVDLSGGKTTGLQLSEVLFSTTEPKLYIRGTGTDDIFVETLSGRASDGTNNDFVPYGTQLGAGTGPSDMALFDDGDQHRLLVASPGSSEVVVIDSNSNNATSVPLGVPGSSIRVFQGPSPSDTAVAPRALVYTVGSSVVSFVDLTKLSEQGASNVEQLPISEAYGTPIPLDDHTLMLPHVGTGLSVLNLWDRTVSIISGPNLSGAVADGTAQKLWLAHGDKLGYLDLTRDFHPSEVRVDAPITALVTVPSKSPKVVVTHASGMGWATVLDATAPSITTAYSMRGFFFDGVLQGGG